eukprot:10888575-Alexandrium_andersonii.AAC.1
MRSKLRLCHLSKWQQQQAAPGLFAGVRHVGASDARYVASARLEGAKASSWPTAVAAMTRPSIRLTGLP